MTAQPAREFNDIGMALARIGVTAPDLAREAGVSASTVYRAIHDRRAVRASTGDKLITALEALEVKQNAKNRRLNRIGGGDDA